MKKTVYILVSLFLFVDLYAQSSFLEEGVSGTALSTSMVISDNEISSAGGFVSYSIAGFIDLGLSSDVAFSEYEDHDVKEFNFSAVYSVLLIKQPGMPVSVQLTGTYGLTTFAGSYLDENNIEKDGRGYSFGVNAFRDNYLNKSFAVRLGSGVSVKTYDYTTDVSGVQTEDRESLFYYNFHGGVIFKTRSKLLVSLLFYALYDEDDNASYSPAVQITSPFN